MKSSHDQQTTTNLVKTDMLNRKILKISKLKLTVTTVISALTLTGCQSYSTFHTEAQSSALTALMSNKLTTEQQSILAKNTLVEVLKKQRTRAYRYRIDMIASNQSRLAAFEQATHLQLSMSDLSEKHCEHLHDEAYASLLHQIQLEGTDIEDAQYSTQRKALNSAYIDCKSKQVDWENSRYQSVESANNDTDSEVDGLTIELLNDNALANAIVTEKNTYQESESDINQQLLDDLLDSMLDDTPQGKFLPNYDSAHTKLDARKARLLDAYLLKPTSISIQGVYQPLLGKISITPTLRYQVPNLTSIANHYIFFNAKEGAVYIWADTYAYLLSIYFDEQLGISMHNKWLKLDLNDGSLPNEFGRDFISSHFAAKDKALKQIPSQRYRILTYSQLLATEPKVDAKFLPYLQSAPYVIERRLTEEDTKVNLQTYLDTFYQQITDKYPELVKTSQTGRWGMLLGVLGSSKITEDTVVEAEKEAVVEEADAVISVSGENEVTPKYNSRQLIINLLSLIHNTLVTDLDQTDSDSLALAEDKADTTSNSKINKIMKHVNNPALHYALYDPNTAENQWLWRDIYAIDTNKRMHWHFKQYKLAEKAPVDEEMDILRGIELQSLTHYEPVTIATPVFNTLPEGTALPNAENTIDIRQYTQELLKRYDEGGGAPLGRDIIEGIKIGQIPLPAQ